MVALLVAGCLGADGPDRKASSSDQAVQCPPASEWPQTADEAWLRGVFARERFLVTACTGSAYVIRLRGNEIYVSAFGPVVRGGKLESEDTAWVRETAGTRIYGNDIRAVWIANGRYVWVEAGADHGHAAALERAGAARRGDGR